MFVYDISSCIVIHIYGCFMEQMTGYHCEKERTYHETVVVPQRCPATFCAAEVRHSRSGWPWRVLALTQAERVPREKNLNISAVRACVLVPKKYIYIHILLYYILVYYYVICSLFYSSYLIYSFHPVLSCPASATCSSAGGGGTRRRLRLATRASQRLEPPWGVYPLVN